jgi:uncharacterized membrane protein YdjX (TVP38/TMEM64 family)
MSDTSQPVKFPVKKAILLVAVLVVAAVGYAQFGDVLSFHFLATKESGMQAFKSGHPVLVVGIAFAIYVAITGLSLPGAAILTLVYGWFFGFSQGLLLVSFASTAGATLAFLFSRFVLRDTIVAKFGERLKKVNSALEKEGAFYLFTLRLLPVMPFFIINLLMGLTPVKTRTYWWVSQLGMLPGTAVYVYAGSQVPSLQTLADKGAGGILSPGLLIAFVLLGIFPIAVKKIMNKIKKSA